MNYGSDCVTRGVRVRVEPHYLPTRSDPTAGLWAHAYTVVISNEGHEVVQLLSRHWVITNARGETEHVRGPGVVGDQPRLEPGQSYTYTSGCPLDTNVGTMHGSYQMVVLEGAEAGEAFDAEIAPFTLAEPFALN